MKIFNVNPHLWKIPELRLIQNIDIRAWVEDIFVNHVNENFWTSKASKSGRFHTVPQSQSWLEVETTDSQLDSVRRTAIIAHHLSTLFGLNPKQHDIVVAAALLHDIEAGAPDWENTNPNHARLAAEKIRTSMHAQPDWLKIVIGEISYIIEHHMSWWGNGDWEEAINNAHGDLSKMTTIVACGDYLSSRGFDCWVMLKDEQKYFRRSHGLAELHRIDANEYERACWEYEAAAAELEQLLDKTKTGTKIDPEAVRKIYKRMYKTQNKRIKYIRSHDTKLIEINEQCGDEE